MSVFDKAAESLNTVFKGAVTAYLIAIPVHDIWTGDSLLAKTWNSAVVGTLEDTAICRKDDNLRGTFLCKRRGDGKGLETLIPRR